MEFDIEEKIDMFKDTKYTNYIEKLKDANKIRLSSNGKIYIDDEKGIKPFAIKSINKLLDDLSIKKKYKMNEYYEFYCAIQDKITNDPDINLEKYKQTYETLLKDISEIDTEIDKILEYRIDINTIKVTDNWKAREKIKKKYRDIIKNLEEKNEFKNNTTIYVNMLNYLDKIVAKKSIFSDENKDKEDGAPQACRFYIDFYLDNVYDEKIISKKEDVKKEEVKPIVKILSNKENEIIKDNVKKLLLSKFKFKTIDECASKKHSQPYYMSLDEIRKTIKGDDKLKKKVKKITGTKEEICKDLFFED